MTLNEPEPETLDAAWRRFNSGVLGPEMGAGERGTAAMAFIAGMSAALAMITRSIKDGGETAALHRILDLAKECDDIGNAARKFLAEQN